MGGIVVGVVAALLVGVAVWAALPSSRLLAWPTLTTRRTPQLVLSPPQRGG